MMTTPRGWLSQRSTNFLRLTMVTQVISIASLLAMAGSVTLPASAAQAETALATGRPARRVPTRPVSNPTYPQAPSAAGQTPSCSTEQIDRQRAPSSGASEATCFSPEGNCDQKLIGFINAATQTLDIAVFDITNDGIANAIIAASKHVRVRMIVDRRQSKGRSSNVPALFNAGIQMKLGNQKGIMHNKFTIVDGAALETGSYNYTVNATQNNNENQLYLTSPGVVSEYQGYFEKIWGEGITVTSAEIATKLTGPDEQPQTEP